MPELARQQYDRQQYRINQYHTTDYSESVKVIRRPVHTRPEVNTKKVRN